MRGWRTVAALTGASFGGIALAQDYIPAPPQIDGELSAADSVDSQGRRYDEYAVELEGGDTIIVTAAPGPGSRAEPVIEVHDGGGGTRLAQDLRSGGDREARLLFTARERAVYRIRVVAGSAAAGRYALRLRRGPAGPSSVIGGSGIGGSILRGIVGGTSGRPLPPDLSQENAAPLSGPRVRFIICPGHPGCRR